MLIGYASVSTTGQDLETQKEILEKEGCEKLFVEKVTDWAI
ncbi:recombinase family protein [Peribacillus butanolivorans]